MTLERYMQPVAVHRTEPERLLLQDAGGGWFLWTGEQGAEPVELPPALGCYLLGRPETCPLEPCQRMWFVVADLPVRRLATPNPEVPEQEYLV